MTSDADSAVAIWDGLRNSRDITVSGNLITGGGFAIYAEDYNPGDGGPGADTRCGRRALGRPLPLVSGQRLAEKPRQVLGAIDVPPDQGGER